MNLNSKLAIALTGFALAGASAQAAFNFQVSGVQTYIGTATTTVPTGLATNQYAARYDSGTVVGDFAVFDMDAVNGATTTDFADLKVTYFADNGGVGSNVMIARTNDSQGLLDAGTISIVANFTGPGTIGVKFEWYTPGSFSGGVEQIGATLLSTSVNYTTFDIDYLQVVSVEKADLAAYTVDNPTKLSVVDNGTTVTFADTTNTAATTVDPVAAAQFTTIGGTASHTITMGKNSTGAGPSLFMFEFRDPSANIIFEDPDVIPIPEPSTTGVMVGAAALALFFVKRRRNA